MAGIVLLQRRRRFMQLLVEADRLSTEQLIAAMRARFSVSALARCAALRTLIDRAPLEVTRGQPVLIRRRYVREHYQV